MSADNFLNAGIQAFHQHRLESAQARFAQAVVADPDSQDAWLWLARVIGDSEHRLYCYQRVLEINPRNSEALQAFQFVAASARPASVQRALALAFPPLVRRDVTPLKSTSAITSSRPTPPRPSFAAMPLCVFANLVLLLIFLSLYILVEWNNVTTSVQNAAITPATIVTRALSPIATRSPIQTLTPTRAATPRGETSTGKPSDPLFAQAQQELDAKNPQKVLDLVLANLNKLTAEDDLADAYYFLGRAELDLEDYRAAAGYLKQLYALDPSVENLFMLAVSSDMAGDPNAALENYSALAAWNGKDAAIYHGIAGRRIADIQKALATTTPTVAK